MKTQYYTASSLDGFIADERNSLDWLFQFGDGPGEDYAAFMAGVGAVAMGSTTYEWILSHLAATGASGSQPWPYELPVWVFTSRELPRVEGADLRFVRGDVRPVHRDMAAAAGGKNVWIAGGGDLVGQFFDHGLLDELIIGIASVTLGAGAPLLPRRIVTPPLRLVSAVAQGTAFVQLTYEVPTKGAASGGEGR
jgi:dihydrofolate reductase